MTTSRTASFSPCGPLGLNRLMRFLTLGLAAVGGAPVLAQARASSPGDRLQSPSEGALRAHKHATQLPLRAPQSRKQGLPPLDLEWLDSDRVMREVDALSADAQVWTLAQRRKKGSERGRGVLFRG